MTGYMSSVALLERVRDLVAEMKKANPEVAYMCGSVMGDQGFLYIPAVLLPVYKTYTPDGRHSDAKRVRKLAAAITIRDDGAALDAKEAMHEMGATSVVITQTTVKSNMITLLVFASKRSGHRTSLRVDVPRMNAHFCGTGDLFAPNLVA